MKNDKELKLPEERSEPVKNIGGYSLLIYGRKKIGKTTFTRWFPKTLHMMFEPGAKKLRLYKIEPQNWLEVKQYVKLIRKDKRFETIVIDPPDIMYDLCSDYVCKSKLMVEHPSDAGWGKGWREVKKEFLNVIGSLLTSGKGVIFISHQKEHEVELRDGTKLEVITNTMPKQAKEIIEGLVDLWANYDYDGKRRVLHILGDEYLDVGHRLNENPDPKFLYTDKTPIREIDMGKTSKEAYENFMKAFNNELIKPERKEDAEQAFSRSKLERKFKTKTKYRR